MAACEVSAAFIQLCMFDNCSFKFLCGGGSLRNPLSQMEPRILIVRELVNELNSSCRHAVGERQYL
eukprot:4140640-Heterocapsa_arctica.AAC.1